MPRPSSLLLALGLTGAASALPAVAVRAANKTCVTHTIASTVPTATALAFQEYSYCAGTLYASAYINNTDYNKIVTLYYTNANNVSTPLSVVQLGFVEELPEPNPDMQIWAATVGNVNLDGITQLLNITYAATDVGLTFSEVLNIPVVASGAKPSTSAPPVPYASPTGFSSDITKYLAAQAGSEAVICKKRMFNNIQVTGAAAGTVVAAQSYDNPDYGYNWVRDSSLTMDVVASLYAASTNTAQKMVYENLLFNYSIARATEQIDTNLQTGLGEPKFNLDNSIFTGPWGRPQNDGPATAAITLMEFANTYLAAGGSVDVVRENIYNSSMNPGLAPVMKDLLFVASNWSSPSFDLWEEEEGDHFYTRMVQYRALTTGALFATKLSDPTTSTTLTAAATALLPTLAQFWDPIRGYLLYEYGPVLHNKYTFIDSAVLLGLIHGANPTYTFTTDKSLASAYHISTTFLLYNISSVHTDRAGRPLGIPIGRYPEDVYNGYNTNSAGNPWYLCTSAMAEYLYSTSTAFSTLGHIKVTKISLPFWSYYSPQTAAKAGRTYKAGSTEFASLINSLNGWGDAYMRTVKFYTPANGHLAEEVNRDTGVPQGAIDLTWSYAAVITAGIARARAMGAVGWVQALADVAVSTNGTGVGV